MARQVSSSKRVATGSIQVANPDTFGPQVINFNWPICPAAARRTFRFWNIRLKDVFIDRDLRTAISL